MAAGAAAVENCWERRLVGVGLNYVIQHYLVPPQFLFGVAGNLLTLVVLNSSQMRSKTTTLLSCMTFCDIGFLCCRLPNSLATYSLFSQWSAFRHFYFSSKIHLNFTLGNFFSTASIWFAVAVTVERTIAISCPLRSHGTTKWTKLLALISSILLLAGALNIVQSFWWDFKPMLCDQNGTIVQRHRPVMMTNATMTLQTLYHGNIIVCNILVIFGPFIAMTTMNVVLVYFLRQSHASLMNADANSSNARQRYANEQKITLMVMAIVGSFLVLNFPSAALHLVNYVAKSHGQPWHRAVTAISNHLIFTAKTINFLLYCMASKHFRRNIPRLGCHLSPRRSRRRQSAGDLLELSNLSSARSGLRGLRRKDTRSSWVFQDAVSSRRASSLPKTSQVRVNGAENASLARQVSSPTQAL